MGSSSAASAPIMPHAVHRLLAPVDTAAWPASDQLEVAQWAATIATRQGRHTPGFQPLAQRYSQDGAYYIVPSVVVQYGSDLSGRTKVMEVCRLQTSTDGSVVKSLLLTNGGQFTIETITYGPETSAFGDGQRHYQRFATDCHVRAHEAALLEALQRDPKLLPGILYQFEAMGRQRVNRLREELSSAENTAQQLLTIRSRIQRG